MVQGYQRLYPGAYASAEYVGTVRALIDMLQERYEVNRGARRLRRESSPASTPDAATPNAQGEETAPPPQGELFGSCGVGSWET